LKIIELIFDLSPGGAERFVVDLSNELAKSEEVVLITLKDDSVNPGKRRFYLPELSQLVQYRNLGIPDGKGFSISTFRKIFMAVKHENADVLHVHLAPIVNFCLPTFFILQNKLTLVQTLHTDFKVGHSSLIYKILFGTLGRRHKMRWVALSRPNYEDLLTAHPKILGKCIRNARGPVCKTGKFSAVQEELKTFKRTDETKIFIHVARCLELKNQLVLVKAFNALVGNGADAALVIIGAGFDSALGESIKDEASKHIHFLGTRTNVSDYLLNSDCFCISSLYEGMPISVLEAVQAGLPVVSTPLPGVLDIVRDGFNASISSEFDEKSYFAALQNAYQSIERMSVNAAEARDNGSYGMKECARQYLDFFTEQ